MESSDILDCQLSASSYLSRNCRHCSRGPPALPSYGRLNCKDSTWIAGLDDDAPWFQVDFAVPKNLTGVITQGWCLKLLTFQEMHALSRKLFALQVSFDLRLLERILLRLIVRRVESDRFLKAW